MTVSDEDWLPRVLVVDDSTTRRIQVAQWFRSRNYPIQEAGDGSIALRTLRMAAPDQRAELVVSDVNMPNLDGIGLAAKMKENEEFREIPIILYTTSRLDAASRDQGIRAGAVDYLRGAVDYEKLGDVVELKVRGLRSLRRLAAVRSIFKGGT